MKTFFKRGKSVLRSFAIITYGVSQESNSVILWKANTVIIQTVFQVLFGVTKLNQLHLTLKDFKMSLVIMYE